MRVCAAGFLKIGFLVVLASSACGGDPNVASNDGGLSEGGTTGKGGGDDGGASNSDGEGGSGAVVIPVGGGGNINPGKCEPKTCEDVGAECGTIPDGCGDVLDCGECDDDGICGLKKANKCTSPNDVCERIPEDEACAGKQCGFEGDGCGGTYECGTCEDGEVCGSEVPFECGPDTGGPTTCQAKIESCESVGAECGIIGDGCGGTIDCNEELGGCPDGTFCGAQQPYRCDEPPQPNCTAASSCAELGWECGMAVDECGNVFDCADEGRTCGPFEACIGGIDSPTVCQVPTGGGSCELCAAIPGCTDEPTRLTGRVITPGRSNNNTGNQVGVPNAFVYILRTNDENDLPAIGSGIPQGGTACDRCDQQELGPVLAGAMTDAAGEFVIEGNVPVGEEFLLVVKAGKFRRAQRLTLPAEAACKTTALPTNAADNPTRLPRSMSDGIAVNIPRIAVATGKLDAMECVFEKIGIAHSEFGNPGNNGSNAARIHLYQGGGGARYNNQTPLHSDLWGSLNRLSLYDIVVADCEGESWKTGFYTNSRKANVREYVNRGGRLFASHLNFMWIHSNGSAAYDEDDPFATGIGPSATFSTDLVLIGVGTGIISLGRPNASPRIENFRDWMVNESVTSGPNFTFDIDEPRSQVTALGGHSEEFVHCDGQDCKVSGGTDYRRTQQFSFNTPYGAPSEAACGRVAYSGFHVSIGDTLNRYHPEDCSGNLTNQEKVLLYMLFDLGACVGEDPTPPTCTPIECGDRCGVIPDGCGGVLNCGSCTPSCTPTTCEAQGAECGAIGDGCGDIIQCGPCPEGQVCGATEPNKCGGPGGPGCEPLSCEDVDAECGSIGDGCGDVVDCGQCPKGEICGLITPFKCDPPPPCTPLSCAEVGAQCGTISDGCGSTVNCGTCPNGQTCIESTNRCAGVVE